MLPNNYGIWTNAETGETCVIFAEDPQDDYVEVHAYVLDRDYYVLPHASRLGDMIGVAYTPNDAARAAGIADGDWQHLAPPAGSTWAHMTPDHPPSV